MGRGGAAHEGNQNSSPEEVELCRNASWNRLLGVKATSWIDRGTARSHQMTANDVLVVAPYNSHVALLSGSVWGAAGGSSGYGRQVPGARSPGGQSIRWRRSTPEDAPRGMEFLYSSKPAERGHIAQARCRMHPRGEHPSLFEPECKTPRQMQLANAICRYRRACSFRCCPVIVTPARAGRSNQLLQNLEAVLP